jgi:hypothetical protein
MNGTIMLISMIVESKRMAISYPLQSHRPRNVLLSTDSIRTVTFLMLLISKVLYQFFTNLFIELSEYKCLFPYVFYCKGNIELYIQSMYEPTKVLRHELKGEGNYLLLVDL